MDTATSLKLLYCAIAVVAAAALAFAFTLLFSNNTPVTPPFNNEPPGASDSPVTPTPSETRLFFGGDIMLGREVQNRMRAAQNYNLPYTNIQDVVRRADLSFANLESPFTNQEPITTSRLVFHNDDAAAAGLAQAGFDVLSTANNHTLDQGPAGLLYTLEHLQSHNITPVGTGTACHSGIVRNINGIKFGFLAYTYAGYNDGGSTTSPLFCHWNDEEQMAQDITLLKTQADFVVVSAHFGTEYQRHPHAVDAARARAAIDAGADMLVGHHPHWIQTIEEYRGKYIFYSLGNLVFDQMWSQDTREGLTLDVLFKNKTLDTIKLLPVVIDNYCCPRWTTDAETTDILRKINPDVRTNILTVDGRTAPDWANAVSAPTLDKSTRLP